MAEHLRNIVKNLVALFNFNEQRRRLDIQILWPGLLRQAKSIDHARAAFAVHAFNDPAWRSLDHDEIVRRIDNLPAAP